jgi:hypothetical protein
LEFNSALISDIYECVPSGGKLYFKNHEAASDGLEKSEDLIITNFQMFNKYLNNFELDRLKTITGTKIMESSNTLSDTLTT